MTDESREPGEEGPGDLAIPALASVAGAGLGYLLHGADGAMVGGGSIPYLAMMLRRSVDDILADRARRAEEMLQSAGEAAGLPPYEFAELTRRSARARFLTDSAIQAAADTFWPPGVSALGRALAAGLIEGDDTTIDIPKMILPAMTEMVAPHLQLLDLLVMCRWNGLAGARRADRAKRIDDPATAYLANTKSVWTARQIEFVRPTLAPALSALIGTLERRGLIEQNDNTAEALTRYSETFRKESNRTNRPGRQVGLGDMQNSPPAINSIQARGLAPERSWSPTTLGEQMLGYYELAADASNQVLPPQAGQQPTSA